MMNKLVLITGFSAAFQVLAAVMAIRLIRVSGALAAWLLLSAAFLVQGIRRGVSFWDAWHGVYDVGDIVGEMLGTVVSLLVVLGVWQIRPCFLRYREIQKALTEKREELTNMNRELAESETRYRTVADFTSDWEFWIAPDGSLRYTSPSCEQITGYPAADFYHDPKLITRIIHPDDVATYHDHTAFLQDGEPIPIDFRIIRRDGEERWISHVCRRVVDADGTPLGFRAGNRDISIRKGFEEALRQHSVKLEQEVEQRQRAKEALALKQSELEAMNRNLERRIEEAVNEVRSKDQLLISQSRHAAMGEMISYIAHQWRNPLNNLGLIIQGMRQDFISGLLTGEQMELYVKKEMELVRFMSQTIDDFRDFFRPDKATRLFSVRESIARAISLVDASMKDNRIEVAVEPGEDLEIEGHPNEYAQALLNLLGNARDVLLERDVKSPVIKLSVLREGESAVITVCDNGGGIADDVIDRIFDPYFSTKQTSKGWGIGLFMAKTIIEKSMGGRLSVRNIDGGAEFCIRMQLPQCTSAGSK